MESIQVIAGFDWLEREETIGLLRYENLRGSDVFAFEYSKEWLLRHPNIFLGQDIQPFTGVTMLILKSGGLADCSSRVHPLVVLVQRLV